MSNLALFDLFEYLHVYVTCLQPAHIFYSFSAGIDFRRHNLTSKIGPRAQRVKTFNPHSLLTSCLVDCQS